LLSSLLSAFCYFCSQPLLPVLVPALVATACTTFAANFLQLFLPAAVLAPCDIAQRPACRQVSPRMPAQLHARGGGVLFRGGPVHGTGRTGAPGLAF
jgi:hypothetical protein